MQEDEGELQLILLFVSVQQSSHKAEPRNTPASKLAQAAKSFVPETIERSPKKSKAKTPSQTPGGKVSPRKETPRKPEKDEDVIPPSLEKKKSGYRNFMMREGPRALGSKDIPQVIFMACTVFSPQ